MARGKSEFSTMGCPSLDADNPNASLYSHNLQKPAKDVDVNGGPDSKVHEIDPMHNLMQKGLVHHMDIPKDVMARCEIKGFVHDAINEAKASTKSYQEKKMRGNTTFKGMDGFGIETKGGTDAECMPNKPGHDVLEDEKLSNKAKGGEGKKGGLKTDEDDLTFAKDLNLVGGKAKEDIADGYVSDIQGERVSNAKGFDRYNEMVSKGIAADVEINPYNVGQSLDALDTHAGAVCKSLDEGIETKAAYKNVFGGGAGLVRSARLGAGKVKEVVGEGLKKVGGLVPGRAAAAESLRSGTTMGEQTLGKRAKRAAADILHDKRKVGGAVVGAGAIGAGAAANKATEDKCSKAPMKVKTAGGAFDEE